VAERAHYSKLFEDPNVLSSICEKVIIPNVEFGSKWFYVFMYLEVSWILFFTSNISVIISFHSLILSLISLSASDEELFGDNPEEYLRRDLEGSDVGTRRRSACNLVKALSTHFESQMMSVFGNYVQVRCANFFDFVRAYYGKVIDIIIGHECEDCLLQLSNGILASAICVMNMQCFFSGMSLLVSHIPFPVFLNSSSQVSILHFFSLGYTKICA
jgi:hypothetical protein